MHTGKNFHHHCPSESPEWYSSAATVHFWISPAYVKTDLQSMLKFVRPQLVIHRHTQDSMSLNFDREDNET